MNREIIFHGQYNDLSPYSLIWSPDGQHIAAIVRKQSRVIQLSKTIASYNVNDPGESTVFAWSPDGRYLAVNTWRSDLNLLSPENTFYVWNVAEQRIVRSYDNSANSDFQALAWSRDGKHIIAIGSLYRQENWDWS
jgi:Tol biopolymer transport system component